MKTFKTNDEFLAEVAKAPSIPADAVSTRLAPRRVARTRCRPSLALPTPTVSGTQPGRLRSHEGRHPPRVHGDRGACSCGNTFTTRSTTGDMHVELCSECHPFYTGKQKLVDSGGRIDRFERRYGRRKKSS